MLCVCVCARRKSTTLDFFCLAQGIFDNMLVFSRRKSNMQYVSFILQYCYVLLFGREGNLACVRFHSPCNVVIGDMFVFEIKVK